MSHARFFSWIIPIKNEADSLPQLFSEISRALHTDNFEILAINDASTDRSQFVLEKLKHTYNKLTIFHAKKHIGKWAALSWGFEQAQGDVVITIDADLQDDPNQVHILLKTLKDGYDVVSGWRKIRHDELYKRVISDIGNKFVSLVYGKRYHDINAPMKVYKKTVIQSLPKHGSLLRFSLLFADRIGFRTVEIPILHRHRQFGRSKFGFVKYIRILYDLILIFFIFSGSGRIIRVNDKK